jgi:hypothetical protein
VPAARRRCRSFDRRRRAPLAEDAADLALVDAEHRAKLFLRDFSPLVESLDLRSPLDGNVRNVSHRVGREPFQAPFQHLFFLFRPLGDAALFLGVIEAADRIDRNDPCRFLVAVRGILLLRASASG